MTFDFTKGLFAAILLCIAGALTAQNAEILYSEDFSDGIPEGWTSVDQSGQGAEWTWCNDPNTGQDGNCPAIWNDAINEQEPFSSETASNGFVTMDSDILTQLPENHLVELTTTAFDFSANEAVWITMQTHIGVFAVDAINNAILRVSTDGENWTPYVLFPTLNTQARWSENPATPTVNISETAAGQSNVCLQFQRHGN